MARCTAAVNLEPESSEMCPLLDCIKIACCEREEARLVRPPDTYSDPGLHFRQTDDDDTEMISVIRFVPPNKHPPSVGKGEFSAVEAKAAALETVGR